MTRGNGAPKSPSTGRRKRLCCAGEGRGGESRGEEEEGTARLLLLRSSLSTNASARRVKNLPRLPLQSQWCGGLTKQVRERGPWKKADHASPSWSFTAFRFCSYEKGV